jgi:two-component system CheB/CheR fusion protein
LHYTRIDEGRDAAPMHSLLEPKSRKGVDEDGGAERPRARPAVRRVLVVEDNLDAVHSLVVLLRQDGHQVDFAINGYAALDVARRFAPEVVLLDLGLPGLDGYDVCRRLKQASPHTRVIAVTAYGSDEQHARARAAGCDLHVVKPYDPQRLLALVRSI